MVILSDTQGTMNPGDIPLSQDYTLGQHQTLTYTAQVHRFLAFQSDLLIKLEIKVSANYYLRAHKCSFKPY